MNKRGISVTVAVLILVAVIIVAGVAFSTVNYQENPQLAPALEEYQRGTHLACESNTCKLVSGGGPDDCSPEGSYCGPTHTVCTISNTCITVTGSGPNECATNSDCR